MPSNFTLSILLTDARGKVLGRSALCVVEHEACCDWEFLSYGSLTRIGND